MATYDNEEFLNYDEFKPTNNNRRTMKAIASINLDKIDKSEIVKGEKGRYLNLEVIIRDQEDEYGNRGFVSQGVSKERRKAEDYGDILGNVRFVFDDDKPASKPQPVAAGGADLDDDLPF